MSHDEDDDEIEEIFFHREGDEGDDRHDDSDMHDGDEDSIQLPPVQEEGQKEAVVAERPISTSTSAHQTPHRWTRKDPPNSKNSLANTAAVKAAPKQTRLNPVLVVHKAVDPKAPPKKKLPPQRPLSVDRSAAPGAPVDKLKCPICACMLETDNAGLNAHIDWCLSRGEIKRASAG